MAGPHPITPHRHPQPAPSTDHVPRHPPPPQGGKKKRNPQEIWMDILSAAAEEAQGAGAAGMSALLRDLLPRMVDMGNVPRNEKKFRNYLKNSFRVSAARQGLRSCCVVRWPGVTSEATGVVC